jgi:hypothetical protein
VIKLQKIVQNGMEERVGLLEEKVATLLCIIIPSFCLDKWCGDGMVSRGAWLGFALLCLHFAKTAAIDSLFPLS